jgi:hypothetical protein
LKPGFHFIGSRVETPRRLSSYGSTAFNLHSPTVEGRVFCSSVAHPFVLREKRRGQLQRPRVGAEPPRYRVEHGNARGSNPAQNPFNRIAAVAVLARARCEVGGGGEGCAIFFWFFPQLSSRFCKHAPQASSHESSLTHDWQRGLERERGMRRVASPACRSSTPRHSTRQRAGATRRGKPASGVCCFRYSFPS